MPIQRNELDIYDIEKFKYKNNRDHIFHKTEIKIPIYFKIFFGNKISVIKAEEKHFSSSD